MAEDLPLIEGGGKGELVASGDLLDGEGLFGALRWKCRQCILSVRLGVRIGLRRP